MVFQMAVVLGELQRKIADMEDSTFATYSAMLQQVEAERDRGKAREIKQFAREVRKESMQRIHEMTVRAKEIRVNIKYLKEDLESLKEIETKTTTYSERAPILDEFDAILSKHGVNREVYHGKSLNGNSCSALGKKATEIIHKLEGVCLNCHSGKGNLCEEIKRKCGLFREAFTEHYSAAVIFSKTEMTTREEQAKARLHVTRFSKVWSDLFPDKKATPKVHLHCAHLPDLLERLGCLGFVSEQGLERTHRLHNRDTADLQGQTFETQTKSALSKSSIQQSPPVQAIATEFGEHRHRGPYNKTSIPTD